MASSAKRAEAYVDIIATAICRCAGPMRRIDNNSISLIELEGPVCKQPLHHKGAPMTESKKFTTTDAGAPVASDEHSLTMVLTAPSC